jgi:predicted nucleotidyltransferase
MNSKIEGVVLRKFRDRDYLITPERYFFCVVGSVHPEDRIIAYLKYVPDLSGKWGSESKRFRRALQHYTMHDLLKTFNFLDNHPEYLFDSKVLSIKMSAVPLKKILKHLKPEEKVSQLLRLELPDSLQLKVVELINTLSDSSGVQIEYFGVTGSVLLDIHQDFSDIDLVVYEKKNSESVKEALKQIYDEGRSPIQRFDDDRIREWCLRKVRMYPLTFEEALRIFKRRWSRGLFHGTMFSLHPVKREEEVTEKFGDRIFKPEGLVKIKARVSDASGAEFLPAIYRVENVEILEGKKVKDIFEVVSYEGLYRGLAEEGERIVAYGKLEVVTIRNIGQQYHRVLIGSKAGEGKDYLKPL